MNMERQVKIRDTVLLLNNTTIGDKRRLQQRESTKNLRLRERGLLGDPAQCRLCLAIQIPGVKFTSTRIKEISVALDAMYGIKVGTSRLDKFSRICPTCKFKLQECYKFYCQVISTEAYLSQLKTPKQKTKDLVLKTLDEKTVKECESNPSPEEMEYIEDHTMFNDNNEVFEIDGANEHTNVDTDLDFDFTDEETEEKTPEPETSLNDTPVKEEEESAEHTKMVNLLLDSCDNGIESQIDCCLIDKNSLKAHEGQVMEEVTVVMKSDPPVNDKEPIPKRRRLSKKVDDLRIMPNEDVVTESEPEYIVCEKCKTITSRVRGSDVNQCCVCLGSSNLNQSPEM